MSDPNACYRCGAEITGFERVYVTGKPYHPLCAPLPIKLDDGGPAFPREDYQLERAPGQSGMSLRDYFAAAALQTLKVELYATASAGMHGATYGTARPVFAIPSSAEIASRSYEIADAMLEARKPKS